MSQNTNGTSIAAPPQKLVSAIRRILSPLVKLMISRGMTYPSLTEILKSIFVEVAEDEFKLEGKPQTNSRISLITGLHRKDVKRLREEPHARESTPSSISLGALLVAHWTSNKDFLDKAGKPLDLPRLERDGGKKSFEGLVKSVSKDIRSRAVLDEWLNLGIASLNDDDMVCLVTDAFIPKKGFDEKAFYFGQNIGDHLAAGTHNMLDQEPPFLERSVYYDGLTQDSIEELSKFSKEMGMHAIHTINRLAIELQDKDAEKQEAKQRINFGVYFFNEPDKDNQEEV